MLPRMGDAIEPLRDPLLPGEAAKSWLDDGPNLGEGRSDHGDDEGLSRGDPRSVGEEGGCRNEGVLEAGTAERAGEEGRGSEEGGRKFDGVSRWTIDGLSWLVGGLSLRMDEGEVGTTDEVVALSSNLTFLPLLTEGVPPRPKLLLSAGLRGGPRSRLP